MAPPAKRIVSPAHLRRFLDSDTHAQLTRFIEQLNAAITAVKLTDQIPESPAVQQLLGVLEAVHQITLAIPPVDNGKSRFGNPAFRDFYDEVQRQAPALHAAVPGLAPADVSEVCAYFCESWGNRTRIDYGSGMELNFICWLLCLQKLNVITVEDSRAVVARVFWKYMTITRHLQTTYWLEPAGSHGAQGLDDYHFAVFIFGSAQLVGHRHLRPKAIHDSDILEEFSRDYMYLSYIRYINSIKTASLRWHSPMLDDISGVKTWDKVNSGMLKMYYAEVLAKLPVAQHFLFGALLPFPDADPLDVAHEHTSACTHSTSEDGAIRKDSHGHLHVVGEVGFGDCCGIAIPSRFAAAEEERRRNNGVPLGDAATGALRRIPFD